MCACGRLADLTSSAHVTSRAKNRRRGDQPKLHGTDLGLVAGLRGIMAFSATGNPIRVAISSSRVGWRYRTLFDEAMELRNSPKRSQPRLSAPSNIEVQAAPAHRGGAPQHRLQARRQRALRGALLEEKASQHCLGRRAKRGCSHCRPSESAGKDRLMHCLGVMWRDRRPGQPSLARRVAGRRV